MACGLGPSLIADDSTCDLRQHSAISPIDVHPLPHGIEIVFFWGPEQRFSIIYFVRVHEMYDRYIEKSDTIFMCVSW